jgi:ribosome-binding protein aMBF1 (putative translation factor)
MREAIREALKNRIDVSRSSATSTLLIESFSFKLQPAKKQTEAPGEPIEPVGSPHHWKPADASRLPEEVNSKVPPHIVGEMLKRYREEAGLTQEQLAELVEMSLRTIKRHERGKTKKIRPGNRVIYERHLSRLLGRPIVL